MTRRDDANDPLRPRRKFSVWTILAPIALLAFIWLSFTAIGESCVLKECTEAKPTADAKDEEEAPSKVVPEGQKPVCNNTPSLCPVTAMLTVKDGDTLSGIAQRFELTEEELKACNPSVDPQTLNKGDKLFISPKRCKGADQAEPGANPDPLADEIGVAPTGQG